MASKVPVVHKLSDIYAFDAYSRFHKLDTEFLKRFHDHPDFYVRAPGRVNLIGEHTDYSGYPVLPMAIAQDVVVAVGHVDLHDSALYLQHVDSATYPAVKVDLNAIHIDPAVHQWTNYFLAGVRGLLKHAGIKRPHGCCMLVEGRVPIVRTGFVRFGGWARRGCGLVGVDGGWLVGRRQGSGLSSSSALVCAAATATMHAQGLSVPPAEMAEMCRLAERDTGVEGGGMDQAISMLAHRGTGKLIRFAPLSAQDVRLPPGAAFVVAHSMVQSNKYVTASTNYNMRVAECRFAALLLAKKLQVPDALACTTLRATQERAGKTVAEMAALVDTLLHDAPYTVREVAAELGLSESEVAARYLVTSAGQPMATPDAYLCRRRAKHVFTETERVFAFHDACASCAAGAMDPATCLATLGQLMDASHASCRDLFDVSCPELETLTALARASGALGSRLTGAGWGGCTVSLVRKDDVPAFLAKMKAGYYASVPDTTQLLFASEPAGGAAIYVPRHGH